MRVRRAAPFVFTLALTGGCSVPDFSYPPGPPRIVRFQVRPFEVRPGADATVSWKVEGASEVRLAGLDPEPRVVAAEGELDFTPAGDTTLELSARGPGGESLALASVLAPSFRAVQILELSVSRARVRPGEDTRVSWRTVGARAVVVSLSTGALITDDAPASGSFVFRPAADVTVRLRADGPGGPLYATADVRVREDGPIIRAFFVEDPVAVGARQTRLIWEVVRARELVVAEVEADDTERVIRIGEGQPQRDSLTLPASIGTRRFRLRIANMSGTVEEDTTAIVLPEEAPRIELFTATPTVTGAGGELFLQWRTRGATQVRLARDGSAPTSVPLTGRIVQRVDMGSAAFLLIATNDVGETTASRSVSLDARRPTILQAEASPRAVEPGDSVLVTWFVESAARVQLIDDLGQIVATSTRAQGEVTVRPEVSGTLQLGAENSFGRTTRFFSVAVAERPVIEEFAASYPAVRVDRPVRLGWRTRGALGGELHFSGRSRLPDPSAGTVEARFVTGLALHVPILVVFNEAFTVSATTAVEVLSAVSGAFEEEPNDTPALAHATFGASNGHVEGVLTDDDVDWISVPFDPSERPIVRTVEAGRTCSDGISVALFEERPLLAPLGPAVEVDAPAICPELRAMNAEVVADLIPPILVRLRRPSSAGPGTSSWELDLLFEGRVCGDGLLDLNEECDDGNGDAGDGCAACKVEGLTELEPNATAQTASPMTPTQPGLGYLLPTEVDWWRFEVPPDRAGAYRIWLEALSPDVCGLEASLGLYRSQGGTLVARVDSAGAGCPELSGPLSVLAAGTWHVRVDARVLPGRPRRGAYALRVAPIP